MSLTKRIENLNESIAILERETNKMFNQIDPDLETLFFEGVDNKNVNTLKYVQARVSLLIDESRSI